MKSRTGFESKLAENWPPYDWQDVTVLVAVSGGADSVSLLRGLVAVKSRGLGKLHAAHLHHGLRGPEADQDLQFVERLCQNLDIPSHIGWADTQTIASKRGDGIEEAARTARYEFLKTTAEQIGARYVATGHIAEDQIETILHRVIRGTSVAGLGGIPRVRSLSPAVSLIRPLLTFRKTEINDYLTALGQVYCNDTTNSDLQHTRNRIRNQLLPELKSIYNSNIDQAILRLGELATSAQAVVDRQVESLWQQVVDNHSSDSVRVDVREIGQSDHYLVRSLFVRIWREREWPRQSMGYKQWDNLARLAYASQCTESHLALPGRVTVERRRNVIVLTKVSSA